MTEAGQLGTLGEMQKACIARGDDLISTLVICYLDGIWRSHKFLFLREILFPNTHTHTHTPDLREKNKKNKTISASHKVHLLCEPQFEISGLDFILMA